jgi:predicted extracellular nuclease
MTFTWAGNSASGNAYRLRPATGPIAFQTANPRPEGAPEVGGSLKVASFNVLNYFLTLDDGGDDCGPAGNEQECRGAETAAEYQRQHVKLMAALDALDADILGLIELENSEGVEPLTAIVDGLNAINGAGTYAYIDTGNIGTDTIKVGIIYKPAAATPLGAHAIIDSSVDPRFVDDLNRPSLAQTFVENSTGEVMTIVVNHLKSKGCGGETGADVDSGDGQGCWNATRTAAAEALVDWMATHPTGIDDDDFLVMGDLNSYAKEDPITALANAGFVDLAALEDDPYSYVFDGQWGYLDYAIASPSLVAQVTGTAEYHINADEVPVLDYNTNFKSPAQIVSLFAPDEFRTSDHDPVVVGLDLDGNVDAAVVAVPFLLWPPNHTLRNVTVVALDHRLRRLHVDIVATTSSEADSGLGHGDLPGDVVPVDHDTVKLRAERYSRSGRTYTIDVIVVSGHQSVVESTGVRVLPNLGGGR